MALNNLGGQRIPSHAGRFALIAERYPAGLNYLGLSRYVNTFWKASAHKAHKKISTVGGVYFYLQL